ncbi:MAG: hypothetical protein ISS33_02305 [Candidatus Omnitrophica bacterium]|nr:hypothetical protein [Candidatus Omnitrophota bacterium]
MRSNLKGMSLGVLFCFLVNTVAGDAAFSQNVLAEAEYKLATQSIFSGLADMEFRESENLKLVVKAHLLEIARGSEKIKIKDLINYAKDHYKNSIFDKTHVYFSEEPKLPKGFNLLGGYHALKCRIKDENDETRTYYAVFSLNKDSDKGFDIEVVASREWDNLKKLSNPLTTLPQRASEKPKDAETQRRYSELNEGVIDKFIREHIGTKENPGRFTEFTGRAKKLGWNTKYPNRARPGRYYEPISGQFDNFLWAKIEQQLRRINTVFQFEIAFKNKNIVLIPLEKNENLPVIEERDPITGKIRKVSVSSHTSKNAVYFFIKQEFLNKIMTDNNPWNDNEIISFFRKRIVHEIGESFGLPIVQITENGRVLNDLDIIYEALIDGSYYTNADGEFDTKVQNLKKLTQNDIVNLDHLRWKSPITGEDVERDYAAEKFEEIDEKAGQILQNFKNISDLKTLEIVFGYVIGMEDFYEFTRDYPDQNRLFCRAFGNKTAINSVRKALKTEHGKRLVAFKKAELDAWKKEVQDEKDSRILQNFKNISDLKTLDIVFGYVIRMENFYEFTRNYPEEDRLFSGAFGNETAIDSVRDALKTEYGKRLVAFKKAELDAWEKEVQDEKESRILQNFKNISDLKTLDIVFGYVIRMEDFYEFTRDYPEQNRLFCRAFGDKTAINPVRKALKTEYGKRLVAFKEAELDAMNKDDGKEKVFSEAYLNFRKVEFIESVENVLSIMDSKEEDNISANEDVFENVFGTTNLSDISNALETKEGKLLVEAYRFEIEQHNALLSELKLREICENFRKAQFIESVENVLSIMDSKEDGNISANKDVFKNVFDTTSLPDIRIALETKEGKLLTEAYRFEIAQNNVGKAENAQREICENFRSVDDVELLEDAINAIDSPLEEVNSTENKNILKSAFGTDVLATARIALGSSIGKNLLDARRTEIMVHKEKKKEEKRQLVFKNFKNITNMSALSKIMEIIDSDQATITDPFLISLFLREFPGLTAELEFMRKALETKQGRLLKKVKQMEIERWMEWLNKEHEKNLKSVEENITHQNNIIKMAKKVGTKITPPSCRYTLFTFNDMYVGDEFKEDKSAFASRFRLLRIGTGKTKGLSRSILSRMTKLGLEPKNVIVQLPSSMADSDVLTKIKEKAQGIKFIVVDTQELKGITDECSREQYRRNIYSMMYLARNINGETRKDSELYLFLRRFVKWHFPVMEERDAEIGKYMQALMENDLLTIIGFALSCMPIQKVAEPNAALTSATFIYA